MKLETMINSDNAPQWLRDGIEADAQCFAEACMASERADRPEATTAELGEWLLAEADYPDSIAERLLEALGMITEGLLERVVRRIVEAGKVDTDEPEPSTPSPKRKPGMENQPPTAPSLQTAIVIPSQCAPGSDKPTLSLASAPETSPELQLFDMLHPDAPEHPAIALCPDCGNALEDDGECNSYFTCITKSAKRLFRFAKVCRLETLGVHGELTLDTVEELYEDGIYRLPGDLFRIVQVPPVDLATIIQALGATKEESVKAVELVNRNVNVWLEQADLSPQVKASLADAPIAGWLAEYHLCIYFGRAESLPAICKAYRQSRPWLAGRHATRRTGRKL